MRRPPQGRKKENMKSMLNQLLLAAVAAAVISLSACGGGGNHDNPFPPGPTAHINSSNFRDAAGIAAAGVQRSAEQVSATHVPTFELKDQSTPGTYACRDGGSLSLSVTSSLNQLTLQNCKSGPVFVASGSINDSVEATPVGQAHVVKIKDLSFRSGDNATPLQTLNGSLSFTLRPDNSLAAVKADFSYTRQGRKESLSLSEDANGRKLLEIQSASFPQALSIDISADEKTAKISSRGDGSSVTVIESQDGKSYTLELRGIGGGAPIASQTLSEAEFKALIQKWL